ncbi:MAG: response regulator rpfG [Rhodospirillaceae bacterium]|nr:MAG: response regulator rpfG [Rhodospirillaceae bacterium]
MSVKILVVEDEDVIRDVAVDSLMDEGYECIEACNGAIGLDMILADPKIDIVLSDILMPKKNGIDMISEAVKGKSENRSIEFIIMTGHGGAEEAIDALKLGVLDFIQKPFDLDYLVHVVKRAEELINLRRSNQDYQLNLEAKVTEKTQEVQDLLVNLQMAHGEALACLAVASDYRDPETGNHIRRIGAYAHLIAKKLNWSDTRIDEILLAAPLHDAGKIGTPDLILLKPGPLDDNEFLIMKQHALNGHAILSQSDHPVMKVAANIALGHHERWSGGGYPHNIKGAEIPIEARIVTLVDVYDALRSKRPYKSEFSQEKTLSIIFEGDGRTNPSHFDPELLEVLESCVDEMNLIYSKWIDV